MTVRTEKTVRTESGSTPPAAAGRGPRSEWFYVFSREIVRWMSWVWFGLRWNLREEERIPTGSGVLLVANHCSYLDPPLVGSALRRPICYLARSSLGRIPVLGRMLHAYGTRFLDRDAPARADLQQAIDLLRRGETLLVFPEGTRSPDGKLHEFKRGVVTLARRTGVPVVALGISGTFGAYPRGRSFPAPVRCRVAIGSVRSADELAAPGGLEALRREIADLSGQQLAEDADTPPDGATRAAGSARSAGVADAGGTNEEADGVAARSLERGVAEAEPTDPGAVA